MTPDRPRAGPCDLCGGWHIVDSMAVDCYEAHQQD